MNKKKFKSEMKTRALAMGIDLAGSSLARFTIYYTELKKWSKNVNLVSKKEPDWLGVHFLDSLAPLALGLIRGDERVADLGSGAGFPGLALKIAVPSLDLVLVESSGKKCAFLRHVSRSLGLEQAAVLEGRFSVVAPSESDGFDLIVSRASAKPLRVIDEAMPSLKTKGRVLIYTSSSLADENVGNSYSYKVPGTNRSWVIWEVVK